MLYFSPAQTSSVGRNVDTAIGMRNTHGHELVYISSSAKSFQIVREPFLVSNNTDYITVYKDQIVVSVRNLKSTHGVTILDAQIEHKPDELFLLRVGRNVSHEG